MPKTVISSGAVPPKIATVRLYQAPIPSPRSSVGNSSLMMAGAIDVIAVYSPSPTQNTTSSPPTPGPINVDSGTTTSAVTPDQTSSCGFRPARSASAPIGYCSAMNNAVPTESARKTASAPAWRFFTANDVSALKNV